MITVRDRSGSFHTNTSTTSSEPKRYCGSAELIVGTLERSSASAELWEKTKSKHVALHIAVLLMPPSSDPNKVDNTYLTASRRADNIALSLVTGSRVLVPGRCFGKNLRSSVLFGHFMDRLRTGLQ